MFDLERKVLGRFTFGPGGDLSPVWSRDGKQVVYSTFRGQGSAIYVKDADGSTPEQLLYRSDYSLLPTSWSPDGKLVAFYEVGGPNKNGVLWMLPTEGEHKVYRLHPTAEADERNGVFSPDGRWFCYESSESGRLELYVVPFPGPGGKWQITQGGGGGGGWIGPNQIGWGTPELQLMASTLTTNGSDLKIGPPRPFFGGKTIPQLLGVNQVSGLAMDFTRDGKRVLIAVPIAGQTASSSLTLVSNWTAELKK